LNTARAAAPNYARSKRSPPRSADWVVSRAATPRRLNQAMGADDPYSSRDMDLTMSTSQVSSRVAGQPVDYRQSALRTAPRRTRADIGDAERQVCAVLLARVAGYDELNH
jgi:hypothetical protein